MRKPVCIKCAREFYMEKAGVIIAELFQKNEEIYRIWMADLWKCPECGVEIIPGKGFADKPLAEHFEKEKMKSVREQFESALAKGEAYTIKEFVRR